MAEYDKGRLFWIKLTDRFMGSDTVDFLMTQNGGANYIVLYQMLCLKTVNNGGVLGRTLGEMLIPYDAEKIQRDCKWFSIDTVRVALDLYRRLGLIYENRDGVLAIAEFDRLIGSQTNGAEKKALQRQRKEENLPEGGQKVDICPPEKDKYKDKYKDTIHSERNAHACARVGMGPHGNVFLTDEEYEALTDRIGAVVAKQYVKRLDQFIFDQNATVADHFNTILKWYEEDNAE